MKYKLGDIVVPFDSYFLYFAGAGICLNHTPRSLNLAMFGMNTMHDTF